MANYKIIFSPTGGTKKCADLLAAGIAENWEELDISLPHPETKLTEEDNCIVAVPSFGGRVPDTAAKRLEMFSGNGAKAILLCVYGNRAFEDTLVELQDILESRGFVCAAAVAALAEHSIMHAFASGRPNAEDEKALSGYALVIKQKLSAEITALNLPGNRPYKEYKVAPMVPLTGDACIHCGFCAEQCPAGAIDAAGEIDAAKCISCMRCTSICPNGARFIDPEKLSALIERLKNALGGHKENQLFL